MSTPSSYTNKQNRCQYHNIGFIEVDKSKKLYCHDGTSQCWLKKTNDESEYCELHTKGCGSIKNQFIHDILVKTRGANHKGEIVIIAGVNFELFLDDKYLPTNSNTKIQFKDCEFQDGLNWGNAKINEELLFEKCLFPEGVCFNETQMGTSTFIGCEIHCFDAMEVNASLINFENTNISESCLIVGGRIEFLFIENSSIHIGNFSESHIGICSVKESKITHFNLSNSEVSSLILDSVKLHGTTSIINSVFQVNEVLQNSSSFEVQNCTFFSNCEFSGSTFHADSEIANTRFKKEVNFQESEFNTLIIKESSFSGSVTFEKSSFKSLTVNSITFEQMCSWGNIKCDGWSNFQSNQFKGQAFFSRSSFTYGPIFTGSSFEFCPVFHDTELPQSSEFRGVVYKNINDLNAPPSYRTLKHAMNKISDKRQEALFHKLELRSIRKQKNTPASEKFFSWIYDKVSEYGQNYFKPLGWMFLCNSIAFLLYLIMIPRNVMMNSNTFFSESLHALKIIIINIVAPFKLWFGREKLILSQVFGVDHHWSYNLILASITSLQTIISLTLVTLFLLALRRSFKLS